MCTSMILQVSSIWGFIVGCAQVPGYHTKCTQNVHHCKPLLLCCAAHLRFFFGCSMSSFCKVPVVTHMSCPPTGGLIPLAFSAFIQCGFLMVISCRWVTNATYQDSGQPMVANLWSLVID